MTTTPSASPVTVLGLGAMGRALAGAFLDAGHPTTVWNRSPGKGDDLVARGAVRADSAADAVRASELVVVCLYDYAASHAVLAPLAGELRGRVLVNLTSDTPERSREAAAWAAAAGIDYLDGAIMVPSVVIGDPEALIFYSGPRAPFDRHEQTLRVLAGRTDHLGEDHGLAALYDNALLDFFWTAMYGLVHGFALAAADGVEARDLARYLPTVAQLVVSSVDGTAREIDDRDYPGEMAPLLTEAANVDHVLHASEHRGLDVGALHGMKAVLDRAIAQGHGAAGWSAVIEGIRKQG